MYDVLDYLFIGFFTHAAICPELEDPANGQVSLSNGTFPGSLATYMCDSNYTLVGNEIRTCVKPNGWTGMEPTCRC